MNDHEMKGKRALLTTSHTDVGSGGSMQMYLLAKGLVDAGARVDVCFKMPKKNKAPKLDAYRKLDINPSFFRPNRWYSPAQVMRMRKRIIKGQYDIIHTHKGGDLTVVLLASSGLSVPVLVNTRGVNFPLGANRFKYNVKKLDRVIVVSRQSKQIMVKCGVRPEKITVIYGGVDTVRFSPKSGQVRTDIRKELGIPPDAYCFIVVANLLFQKGHDDYLKAAALCHSKVPGCYHIFAGSGDQGALRKTASRLGLSDQMIFTGFRQDVPELLAAADVSVFSGFSGEGVSGVLRESLACGVPVITTDVGGNAELIEHENYGLVTPMRNPEALATAMTRMAGDRALAQTLAAQGQKYILGNHSMDARNHNIFKLYAEIGRGKGLNW